MNISRIRKLYSLLPENAKGLKWRKPTSSELDLICSEKQVISNCYDMATREALLSSNEGRKIFSKRIKIADTSNGTKVCKVIFNINGKNKAYSARFMSKNTLGWQISNAVNKMISHNWSQKPLISRFARLGLSLPGEFNKPSNAFKWFTGEKPISIGENGLKTNLKGHRQKLLELFKELGGKNFNEYSFVALSGLHRRKHTGWKILHCLAVKGVDFQNKMVSVMNKRTNQIYKVSFDDFINDFKAIVGLNFS